MGHQIIQQPNGAFAVFSSIIDGFIMLDANKKDIIELWLENDRERYEDSLNRIMSAISAGNDPYHGRGLSWEEASAKHIKFHGPIVFDSVEENPSTDETRALKEAAAWVCDAFDQADTNDAIKLLGSRGEIARKAVDDLRKLLT